MKNLIRIILFLTVIVYGGSHSYTYETSTHSELSRHAVNNSNLDSFLKSELVLSGGVLELLTLGGETRTVREWVQWGSVREDDDFRFLNHFHNPLRNWTQAGLGLTGGKSSILWAQDPGQGFAWKDARDSYFAALTATTTAEREQHFARTFRALGQLIHFVPEERGQVRR